MHARLSTSLMLLLIGISACTTAGRLDLGGMSFSSEPLIGKVVWHDLMTEDLPAAREFYGGLFGWQFEGADGAGRGEYVVARAGDTYVAGLLAIERPDDGTHLSRWLPYISVEDVDDAVSRATASSGQVAAAPRDVPYGRVAAIVDSQGGVVGLARSSLGDPDDRTTAAAPGRPVRAELLAADQADASRFYQRLVGYETRTIKRRNGDVVLLENQGVDRAAILQRPNDNVTPVWVTFFGVEDPVVSARRAATLGGEVILEASTEFRDGTIAIVTDPSGAVLVLQKWNVSGGEES